VRISEILSRLQAIAKRAIPVEQDPALMRASDIPRAVGDASAMRAATGWTPEIRLDQTLHDILEATRTLSSAAAVQRTDSFSTKFAISATSKR
jgi:GDP-4-dehydro-6-deoxy-D-mannose reductase